MFNIDIPAASEQSPCPISMSLHVPEEQRQDGMFAPITLSPQQPVPPPAYPTVSSEEALLAMEGTLHSYNNSRFIKDERFNPYSATEYLQYSSRYSHVNTVVPKCAL